MQRRYLTFGSREIKKGVESMLLRLFNPTSLTTDKNPAKILNRKFDSPVIYGNRVETSNPYYLTYID